MAKVFLGLAIVVMLAAAALGFMAKGNIDQLQTVLKDSKAATGRAEKKASEKEAEAKKAGEELKVANAEVEKQKTEAATAKKEKEDLDKQLGESRLAANGLTAEIERLKIELGKPKEVGVAVEDPRIQTLTADLEKARAENTEKTQLIEQLNKAKNDKDEAFANLNKEVDRYRAGFARNSLTAKILAVNPGWNFVVLSAGDRQGAAPGAVMIVTRGGEQIARARITSVEPSTSIADILPGSVRKGLTVQPGDTVVYEGPRGKSGNSLTAPAPGANPAPVQP